MVQPNMIPSVETIHAATTDDRVFCDLYDQFFSKIYSYAVRRVGDQELAEDIVAATFEKVFLHLERFDGSKGTFQAWIYRIATNEIIDHSRKMKRVTVTDPDELPSGYEHVPNQELALAIAHEQERDVRRALSELPDRYQKVLQLKFFSELSNPEIAETLGMSLGNVGVLLHRALQRFHDVYTAYEHRS